MATSVSSERDDRRREQASRLIALTIDVLDEDSEQIVRDYLTHALGALERVREAGLAKTSYT